MQNTLVNVTTDATSLRGRFYDAAEWREPHQRSGAEPYQRSLSAVAREACAVAGMGKRPGYVSQNGR